MKRLYVGNIPWSTTEENLEEIFGVYGELVSVRIIRGPDGRSRGYAFVEFVEESAAQEALETENGTLLEGRTIRVNKAVMRDRSNGNEQKRYAPPSRHSTYRNYDEGEKRYRRSNRRRDEWQ